MTIDVDQIGRARGRRIVQGRWFTPLPVFLALLATCSFLGLQGCGDGDEPRGLTKKAVAFSDVPEGLRKAAQKQVPEVVLKEAWQNLDETGKLHSYEIRGKNARDGKIREVRVATDGKILETE